MGRVLACLLFLAAVSATSCSTAEVRTTAERVADTEALLARHLVTETARTEAEFLVQLCETNAEEMFYVDGSYEHPGDGKLYTSQEEATEAVDKAGGGLVIFVAEAACTPEQLERVHSLGRV